MKRKPETYVVKHYGKVLSERYHDKDWAIHSAECFASFYEKLRTMPEYHIKY